MRHDEQYEQCQRKGKDAMPTPLEQNKPYDVVVIGASFAGLSFASVAAALGLQVLVVERDSRIGGVIRTTGVLFNDVLDVLDVPTAYLMNAVRRIRVQPPGATPIEIAGKAYRFYMADVSGMLRWMAEQAQQRGVTLCCDTTFLDVAPTEHGQMSITLSETSENGKSNTTRTITTRFLIGADGTRSRVAQRMGLEQNTRYLAGAEWLLEGVPLDGETFYLLMNHDLAPGYCVWLAPHGNIAALGVAGHPRTFSPTTSLRAAQELFRDVADLSEMRVVERKAGIIPTGGRLRRVYCDNSRGRALLLGDAAGLCGAATGGGIYPALISGRLAAHAVASEVLNGERGAIRAYLRNLTQANRLGHYLRIEDWLRWVLDSMKSNADVEMLYGLFASPEGQKVLQHALLEIPIIGMDSNFFNLLRGLLSSHPRIYRSAFQAVWQRVTNRA
jgi:digeranylgeranylglycerophospholipid reductase